jgi:hypothetical protein
MNMSHMSVSKLKIKNPDIPLLKEVIKQVACEMNGTLVTTVRSMEGVKESNFLLGFTTPLMKSGVGVRVTNGQVELVGDFYLIGYDMKRRLEDELTKSYTAAALTIVMRRMGFQVETAKNPKGVILVANY